MRVLSVIFAAAFVSSSWAKEPSRTCREEAEFFTKQCGDATAIANQNNSALGSQARVLAGTDPKVNEGGKLEKNVFASSYNNSKNGFDSCREQRKKLKDTCEEAYKKEEGGKNDPAVKKEITENYERNNKQIGVYTNLNAERMANYSAWGSQAGATQSTSADSGN